MNNPTVPTTSFHFFERLIKILVVDKKPEAGEIAQSLENYKAYCVTRAASVTDAYKLLSSESRFQVCLWDMDLFDVHEKEFSLLRSFASKIPFIIMNGRDSFEQGFKIGNIGTFATIQKPIDFTQQRTFDLINEAFLRGIVRRSNGKNTKPIIIDAINVFIECKPVRVKEWVEKIGIEERYLRRVWLDCFGYQPRFTILLYRLLLDAFEHFNYLYFNETSLRPSIDQSDPCYSDEDFDYLNQRFYSLYRKHKNVFESILKS